MNTVTARKSSPQAQPSSTAPDFAAIKQKQQATWASGDFAIIGVTLQIVGESLAEAADMHRRLEGRQVAGKLLLKAG